MKRVNDPLQDANVQLAHFASLPAHCEPAGDQLRGETFTGQLRVQFHIVP